MEKLLFEYDDYRVYLQDHISSLPRKGRGKKKDLAQSLSCQTTHISQVLNRKAHFSPEQGLKVCHFLYLSPEEMQFFMVLLHLGRAGSADLRNFYTEELDRVRKNFSWSQKRLQEERLIDEKEREIYYSAWYYPVIHVMVSIPKFQNVENIIRYLALDEKVVWEAVNFLLKCGLAKKSGNKIMLGDKTIQFERGTREYKNFLKNLKNRAIFSIDRDLKEDLHSSFVLSLSHEDFQKVKEMLQKTSAKIRKIVQNSSQEDAFILSLDLFLV